MGADDFKKSHPFRSVCEVTRECHDMVEQFRNLLDEMTVKLTEMMNMQKKMDKKLRKYKSDWAQGFFEKNPDWEQKEKRRADETL